MTGLLSRDLTPADMGFAGACTVAVFVVAAMALLHARLEHRAKLPEIDPGTATPIAVRPVADVGLPGSQPVAQQPKRSKKARRSRSQTPTQPENEPAPEPVPDAWRRKTHTPTPLPDVVEPPPTEPPTDPDAPPSDAEAEAEQPPAPDAVQTDEPDADAESAPEEGTGEGGGEPGAEGEPGPGDPLFDRAVEFYRARLVAWFAKRFRVTGSGLSPEQLAQYRVKARIEISEDLRIVSYEVLSADHPAFENAARASLDALRGETLPPPPENYPGAVQRRLTVTFTCSEDACD